jgi:hypothetical protein
MVQGGLKIEIAADRFGDGRQVLMVKVDDSPAVFADQMVVRLVTYDFELGVAPAEIGLADDARLSQSFHGAVDGREVDVMAVKEGSFVDLFGTGMAI